MFYSVNTPEPMDPPCERCKKRGGVCYYHENENVTQCANCYSQKVKCSNTKARVSKAQKKVAKAKVREVGKLAVIPTSKNENYQGAFILNLACVWLSENRTTRHTR